ncbi:TetR/AcrR family transcriptional regulator [Limnofasciculus baicalensis]|uniref:TetR/AcrR family transcriptional regulator n=1 Tax=Limnofasciculus baicalensis BBK-W-15 TaxID=2699891 RepID=A0AAE3GRL1_9CYAN|nr:TetR/AcrR family transcriptional regulator [Limnofasciculus baicalensis]MCP2729401.1 TetR/AcrR family transcriptional regulator [Limnofasciculus baicalensis BBK-W-15]
MVRAKTSVNKVKEKASKGRAKTESPRETSSEKAEQILQGAMAEFLAHGYAATSMDRVASAAKVSKATVYSYFQDKEALFTALVEQLAEENFQFIFNDKMIEGEPKVVLRRLGTTLLNQILTEPDHLTFIRLMIGESARFPNLAKTFIRCITKPGIERLTEYLANCPQLNIPDPEAAARIFLGSVIYYVQLQEMMHGKEIMPMESERLIDSLVHLLLSSK